MRKCPNCDIVMDESNYILDQGASLSDLVLIHRDSNYMKSRYPLKVALCPKCGHVELFVNVKTEKTK